jgi:hypothetical protein
MAIRRDWIPEGNKEFRRFADNFCTIVENKATDWNISTTDKNTTVALHADFDEADDAATAPQTRNSISIALAGTARKTLKKHMRYLKRVYIDPGFASGLISEQEYLSLGLSLPDTILTATPLIPASAPFIIELISLPGFRVRIRFRDENEERSEARLAGMNGCLARFALGGEPISDYSLLTSSELMTASPHVFTFSPNDEGKWFSVILQWQTRKGKLGPYSAIQHVVIS